MSDRGSTEGGGVLTTMLVVFVVLKLTDNIDWSWWWVLAPMWVPLVVVAFIMMAMLIAQLTR